MAKLYVEYALSFGVQSYEGLWKIQYLHPEDAGLKIEAWIPLDPEDELIGEEVNDIQVAKPGEKLTEVMSWLYDRITRYPYYWPKEGTYVDKFGYDFEVELTADNKTDSIEITEIAYEILKNEWRIQPDSPSGEHEVDIQYETVPAGGVLIKLSVTLDRAQPVSDISMAPFTKYPMELVSLMYEEDTETYHPKKEILIGEGANNLTKFEQTTQSIRLQFPVVTAKRITFILRQRNHEKNTYLVNQSKVDKNQLWNDISQREAEVSLDATDGLETVTQADLLTMSGQDIYLKQLAKYQQELAQWQKEFDLYKRKQAEREAALAMKVAVDKAYEVQQSEYRAEYNAAIQKYKTQIAQYQEQTQDYDTAYQKYERELKVYNQYLRDYADWQSKWG